MAEPSSFPNAGENQAGIGAQIRHFGQFLYNSENKTCMGRTGASWGKIGVFYLIFYSCLAAFFAICMSLFFLTIDDNFPKHTGKMTAIKGNPGLTRYPKPSYRDMLIRLKMDNTDAGSKSFVKSLEDFVKSYHGNRVQEGNCTKGLDEEGKACVFPVNVPGDCGADFGVTVGKPCIAIRLNKVFDWTPEAYTSADDIPSEAPQVVKDNFEPGFMPVSCEGFYSLDKDNIGTVDFFPSAGIDVNYYPYKMQDNFQSPFVFARFKEIRRGTLVQVWCKVWVPDITHDRNDQAGSVRLEMFIT